MTIMRYGREGKYLDKENMFFVEEVEEKDKMKIFGHRVFLEILISPNLENVKN